MVHFQQQNPPADGPAKPGAETLILQGFPKITRSRAVLWRSERGKNSPHLWGDALPKPPLEAVERWAF
jgi:hypothetical protein